MTDDPYIDPASGLLRNRLGITDADALARVEAEISTVRDLELVSRPVVGTFDPGHLRQVHRRLFADIYPWAGELRVCRLARSAPFANPAFIEPWADELLAQLAAENHLQGLSRADFVERLTHYLAEINAVHPFREGNGRTQRAFLRQLAAEVG